MIWQSVVAYGLIASIILYFPYRIYWIGRNILALALIMSAYLESIGQTDKGAEYCTVGPLHLVLFDLTNWNFIEYVHNKEQYYKAANFHLKQIIEGTNKSMAELEAVKEKLKNK